MPRTLEEIWEGDLLGRREDAQLLYDFLVRRHAERRTDNLRGAYVVNLNAGWGHGKTFFMERLREQMDAAGHPTAFVNAWRDDSSKDPVVAVMAAIETALKPYFAKEETARRAWNLAKANSATILASLSKGAIRQLLKKGVGEGIEELEALLTQEELVSEDVENALTAGAGKIGDAAVTEVTSLLTKYVDQKLTDYQARIASSATFQSRMNQLLSSLSERDNLQLPFFVLIDELDRCRPTYAIEMLEQVKHLFDVDNTIFIIATDGDQLAHSIRAVYGEGFDGKKYLLRFFHRHYKFEQRDLTAFAKYLFEVNKIDRKHVGTPFDVDPVGVFVGAMRKYSVTLRDAEQCFDILRSILTVWDYKVPMQLTVMLPLIIMYQRHDVDGMTNFIENSGGKPDAKSEWIVKTTMYDDFRRPKPVFTSVEALNHALLTRAKSGLRNIYDYSRGSAAADFVSDVLQREFQVVHNGLLSGDEGPYSIILDYPKIVRRVGRLAPPEPA